MRTEPVICPEHNVKVFHARKAYHCTCEVCQGPARREVEPDAEAEAKQAEAERQKEEVREATRTTYKSGPAANTTPEAAVEDMKEVLEGGDG